MLRFFRTIRKTLMEQNKVRTYFFYAAGEIILVVIGILIALQVNNWNESRLQQERELVYLGRLTENIQSDIQLYEYNIDFYQKVRDSGLLALRFATGEDISEHSNWDILLAYFYASQIWPMDPVSTTYEELKSSGELSLLESVALRDRLAFYYEGAQFRYRQTIGINPPYRKLSRTLIPYRVQSYMWDYCHETVGDIQKLIECEPGISDNETNKIVQSLKANQELTGELGFWVSSIRAGWFPLQENLKLCRTILKEIEIYIE
jgi:hypothetical protein